MKFESIEKAAKIASRRVPRPYQEDVSQEVICRCLELKAQGVALTLENVSATASQVVDYAFRHWVHDQHKRDRQSPVSLDTIVEDSDGNTITLADALPSPSCFSRVEEWALARIALKSLPPQIAKLAGMALMQGHRIPRAAKAELDAWYQENWA